ncbi:Hemin transport protein HemS [compost metagenome]
MQFVPAEKKAAPRDDGAIDAVALADAWRGMQDTHEFFGLLNKFDVERQQSFRLTEGEFTQRAETGAVRELLLEASFDGTPIMVFVGSPGCIQIHSGPVVRIEPMEMHGMQWLNVLDPGFNLHLREDRIASVWIVQKPTSDGIVTSVEAFDGEGELMAMFFGARKPGVPERTEWREIVAKLSRLTTSEAPAR